MENERITFDTPISELIHSDDELYHWKYLKREKVKGKWRYWYDLPSAKKDATSALTKVRDKFEDIFDKYKTKSATESKQNKTLSNTLTSTKKSSTSFISKVADRVKKTIHKYVAKVPTDNDSYRYFYSEKAYKSYLKGKEAVDKILDKTDDKPVGALISDVVKNATKNFVSNVMNTGFGKAVYNTVLPVFTAIQVALQTPKSFAEMKKMSSAKLQTTTDDEHQEAVNPDYDPYLYDYSYNCSFCTSAYDLRKRGYDVEAMPISLLEGPVIEDIITWYDGAKAVYEKENRQNIDLDYYDNLMRAGYPELTVRRASSLKKSLEDNGEGSRGHLCLYWKDGGGHDIIWEVENGEVVFRDCQTNTTYDMNSFLNVLYMTNQYAYVRTDNLEPTEEVLRTVRNKRK